MVKRPRTPPNLTQKLDAALLALLNAMGIPMDLEEARKLPDGAVAGLFDFDHDPIKAVHGGPNSGWNLTPRLRPEHREKTAKKDIPDITKGKRLSADHIEFQKRCLAKAGQGEAPPKKKSPWPSRPMNGKGAKLWSRNNLRKRVTGCR